MADPFDYLDEVLGPRRRSPRRSASLQLTPAQEGSLLESLGHATAGGISNVANVLDTDSSAVRALLVGKNPLHGLFDPQQRTSGRDVLEHWGLLGPNQEGFDLGDVAGVAADIVFDPKTYLTGGLSALSKAGKAAKAASLIHDAAKIAKSGKRVALMKLTPLDLIGTDSEKLARFMAAAGPGGNKLLNKKLGGLVGIQPPFGSPLATFGTGALSQKIAGAHDALGAAARFGNVPGTGYSPGRHLAQLFDPQAHEAETELVQRFGPTLSKRLRKAGVDANTQVANFTQRIRDLGYATPGNEDFLRNVMEGVHVGPIHPELQAIKTEYDALVKHALGEAEAAGLNASELADLEAQYFPRRKSRFAGVADDTLRSQQPFSAFDASSIAREPFLRDIGGATGTIKRLAKDPDVEQALQSGVNYEQVAKLIESKYGHVIPPQYQARLDALGAPVLEDRYKMLARWLRDLAPEERAAGVFGNHPWMDLRTTLKGKGEALARAHTVFDVLAEPGALLNPSHLPLGTPRPETVSLGKVLQDLNIKLGDTTGGALSQLATRTGHTVDDIAEMAIRKDVARDIGRFIQGTQLPTPVGKLGKAYEGFTNLFKGLVTGAAPAFHVRNRTSGFARNIEAGLTSLPSESNAVNLLRGNGIAPYRAGQSSEAAADELRTLAMAHGLVGKYEGRTGQLTGAAAGMQGGGLEDLLGLFPGGLGGSRPFEVGEVAKKAVGLTPDTTLNPFRASVRGGLGGSPVSTFGPLAAGEDVGYAIEGMNRIAPFDALIRQGVDPAEATRRVLAAQVDYGARNFTKTDQTLQKRFPFYKFTKENAKFVAGELVAHPGGRLAQTLRVLNRAHEGGAAVPDYVAETASIPIPEGLPFLGPEKGGDPRYLTGLGMMFEDPLQFAGGAQSAGLELMSRLNPLIKGPLEYATGQSFFQKGPEGGRPLGDMDPMLGRIASNVAHLGDDASVRHDAYQIPGGSLIEPLAANSPLSRLLSSIRVASDNRKGAGARAVNLLTGARLTDVSPGAQDAIIREALNRELRDHGAKAFQDTYVPKEALAAMPPQEQAEALRLMALMKMLQKRAQDRAKEKLKQAGQL